MNDDNDIVGCLSIIGIGATIIGARSWADVSYLNAWQCWGIIIGGLISICFIFLEIVRRVSIISSKTALKEIKQSLNEPLKKIGLDNENFQKREVNNRLLHFKALTKSNMSGDFISMEEFEQTEETLHDLLDRMDKETSSIESMRFIHFHSGVWGFLLNIQ